MRLLCLILLLGIFVSATSTAGQGLEESRTAVKGLNSKTEILIDRWGVPHIYASTPHDAFFAQGWNAARDRLWQIDMWRRSGLGELAAVLGSSYVAQDRAIRLFIYRGDMEKEWAAYGSDAKRNTEAFVAGINAFVAAAKADTVLMPLEFKLAGYKPDFWKADDVVRVRNHGLAGNVLLQVMRAQVACKEKRLAAADLLFKISPPWTPIFPEGLDLCTIPPHVLDTYQLAQKPVAFGPKEHTASATAVPDRTEVTGADYRGRNEGSNNWVISPRKTTTGRPILANDPHRNLDVPSLRYIAHVVAPGLNVIGAGEPALPGITIGHNEQIAFGITVFPIAQEDLYVYETNPQNPDEYRYRDGWEPMRTLHESIAVQDASDVQVELKFTRHGPVVLEDRAHHRAYAVRAAWLDTGGAPYFGSMGYLRAKDIKQFAAALRHWAEPGENHIYADTTGKIGWFPAGFTPIRSNSDGLLPLPGDGRYEWGGYLDRDLLPSETNPSRGYIATANQMNLPKDYPYAERRVGFTWADDFRFKRISEVLGGLPKISMQESVELQNDYVSLPGRRLIGVLGTIRTPVLEIQDVMRWLEDWDGRVTAGSPQAALFEVWCSHHLVSAVIAQAAHAAAEDVLALMGSTIPAEVVELMEHPDARLGVEPERVRDDLMLRTLADAIQETKQRLGPNRSTWRWGQLANVWFEHPVSPLAGEDLRLKMNVGPYPKSGDGNVVGAAIYRARDFRAQVGASFRMILDVGKWDDSVAINTPGQSGDLSSPHYRDLVTLWIEGRYFPLLYSRAMVDAAAERKILLEPVGSASH